MSEPRQVEITTAKGDQNLIVTERMVKIDGKGEPVPYLSISNGSDAMGVYPNENTVKELISFLKPKKGKE